MAEVPAATPRRTEGRARSRAIVKGIVQGVGFRPFVYRLATSLGLGGFVRNDPGGVTVEVEGAPEAVEEFLERLASEAPLLARIDSMVSEALPPLYETGFSIVESQAGGRKVALVSPDVATCEECRSEIFDPEARRYRYPFTNCTNCGPRFTITLDIPYDRRSTTMAGFPMCEDCRREYEDPLDRRFHAQPIACPACGPQVRLTWTDGRPVPGDPVSECARLLREGHILAVKGLGGYHLACDSSNEEAVSRLRARKIREDKP
ncbi:MAG: acylphosphatase, partial [Actinomycetota bacterium]